MNEDRIDLIERQLSELSERVQGLERWAGAPARAQAPATHPQTTHPPTHPPRAPRQARVGPQIDLEELLGGRVLAWLGGAAILVGIIFFLGMAISRGWIDEPTRTVIAFLASSVLVGAGVLIFERGGRTEAALAAVASGLSGLFGTLIVATQIYELTDPELGLAAAALVGAVGVAIAVRWESTVVAGIGILGALLAPVLVGADSSGLSLTFMFIALAAAVGVLLWQKWNWLALSAFAVSTPQLLAWLADHYSDRVVVTLAVLASFWAIYVVAAIGYELRARSDSAPPVASWLLLLGNVVLIAAAGYFVLDDTGHPNAAVAWILGLSGAHIVLGAFALRQPISREIGSLLIAAGLGLSAIGLADALAGPALVIGWAIQAVVLAFLATQASAAARDNGSNAERLLAGSVAFLALAIGHTLAFEAPPVALIEGVEDLGDALVALGVSAAAAFVCGALWRDTDARWGGLGEMVGAATLVYLASVAIIDTLGVSPTGESEQAGQVWLSAFWTLTGLGGVVYGLLRGERRFRLGGLALLGIAIIKVYTYDLAELDELARVLSFIALGLLLLVGAFAYQRIRITVDDEVEKGAT